MKIKLYHLQKKYYSTNFKFINSFNKIKYSVSYYSLSQLQSNSIVLKKKLISEFN